MIAKIKVLHVPYGFHPDPVAGTEIYVEGLARELMRLGVESVIAAPAADNATYSYGVLPVRRFAVAERITDLRELYGAGDPVAAVSFGRILDAEQPQIVHLHALTPAVSIRLVAESRRRGVPVVFTYHTPTVSCQRGTLMQWGVRACDGLLSVPDCAACALHGHGVPRQVSSVLGRAPLSVGRLAAILAPSGGPAIALRMTELVTIRHAALRSLLAEVDVVVAVCGWIRELLLRNGVPESKIRLSRHGLMDSSATVSADTTHGPRDDGPMRIAYAGRLDPAKGIDVLIRAVRSIPSAPLVLDVYGVFQGESDSDYVRKLHTLAGGDQRITFPPPVPNEQIVRMLQGYHALAVPSIWLEAGPLVILEAFAAGIPVIGSRLGGIAELVTAEVDGLLVDPGVPSAWSVALERLVHEPGLRKRLRSGVRPPRRMADVADEMLAAYHTVRAHAREPHPSLAGTPRLG